MSEKIRIPKSAVKPLIEYCAKLSEETGRPAAEIFKGYLESIKKYADFFSGPWPESRRRQLDFDDDEVEFIEGGKNHEERLERFTMFCLRRSISLEGFDSQGFTENFKFYGGYECSYCSVPRAMDLRRHVELIEQQRREIKEDMKQDKPSWMSKQMHEHMRKPDVVKADKMRLVELRLYEKLGGAEDKNCEVKNKYKCPFRELSEELIEYGMVVDVLWKHITWYDRHWNPPDWPRSSSQPSKWYHYDEPSIIDVTSYRDIKKALGDGRLNKIIEEHEKYMKETGREIWAP